MIRRRFIETTATAIVAATAGCVLSRRRAPSGTPTRPPATVTTTGGAAIQIPVAQVVIREGEDGPRIYYQLRNESETDATVEVTTVLHVAGGGSYEASAYADVPAGGEVFLEYRLVRWTVLTAAERASVRRGDADFDVYVNGVERTDV